MNDHALVVSMALRTTLNPRIALISIWIVVIVAAILIIGPGNLLSDYRHVTPHGIKELVLSFGPLSAIVYIMMHAIRPFTFLPVTPFTLAGGYIFGHWCGLLFATTGTTIAATISFFMSRYLFRDYVKSRLSGKYAGVDMQFNGSGIMLVAIMRVIPVIPFDAVSYLAGVSSIKFRHYLIGTIIGELPGAFVLTMLGNSLKDLHSPIFAVSLVLAILLILLPEAYRRIPKKPAEKNVK